MGERAYPVMLVNPNGCGSLSTAVNHACASKVRTVVSGQDVRRGIYVTSAEDARPLDAVCEWEGHADEVLSASAVRRRDSS